MQSLSRRSVLAGIGGAAGLAALAACGGGGGGEPAPGAPGGRWEFTDDLGVRVSLPSPPRRIVAYVSGAAALWDFGVRPVGIYGPSRNDDGSKNPLAGNLDLNAVQSVGEGYTEFAVERLAALQPDLLIASLNGAGPADRWIIKDTIAAQIEPICPIYSIQESLNPLPQVIDSYATLASRLGANVTEPTITQARSAFEAAGQRLRSAIEQKPGLRTEFVYGDNDGFYVASPKFYSTLIWYHQLGLTIARQDDPSTDFYQQLSWEQASFYPSDVVLTDIRSFSLPQQDMIARFPTFRDLPAVRAGQLGGWNGEPRFSYQTAITEVNQLADTVSRARTGVAG